jgi:hypothetical protein
VENDKSLNPNAKEMSNSKAQVPGEITWIIHKSWMMRPGFRLFLKNCVLKPEIQNTLLHKSKEGF